MNGPDSRNHERVETKRKIDVLCDQAESHWRAGIKPDLKEMANEVEHDALPGFLAEVIKVDKEVNHQCRSKLREFYNREFPEYSKIVKSVLFGLFESGSVLPDESKTTEGPDNIDSNFGDTFIGKRIGEYFIEKKIGEGAFGVVFLARDSYLPRSVVIKIPKSDRFKDAGALDNFLDEARNAALLDHPHILKILHVGLDSGMPYIVEEFFEGGDLRNSLRQNAFSVEATIDLVAKLASGIGYAHQNRIVHRDLKPANILLNRDGDPVIADFGLALHETQMQGRSGERAGTVHYMSPEQVRGEAHRLDGRSDIWSIGVILYLMLVGQLPFVGEDLIEISEAILFGCPRPPRQLNKQVTQELDRICLKCLSLRVNDRYSSAYDLAGDLKRVTEIRDSPPSSADSKDDDPRARNVISVVPKGLVAFDENDREFFLQLLPGPFDREGIPECIHFWKNQIENPSRSHPVGLIYGPSGSGKSSMISAGLLPRLADDILVVRIEATPNDTEVRLLKGLRSQIPTLPLDQSLPDLIAGIRRGKWLPKDRRLFIVIDQFEQWLHANQIDEHSQLVHALRHCDGDSVQSLILVRDDFWMAISRFFRQLEIELVERKNFASVDLFSQRHAKVVLVKFGQAFGSLPTNDEDISQDQDEFLDQAIELVSENDSVICVRLVLFAETVKNQPWEMETLHKIGDSRNVGIVFLEQVLGERATNPKYRYYRQPLLAVLESLLPDPGIDIKGNLRSQAELAQAAGLESDGVDFQQLFNLLDHELRLITPTEPDSSTHTGLTEESSELYYQLTHDYLVPSLREWMRSVRGRTRRGRAKIRLQALTNAWSSTGHKRFLPGFFEYCSIASNVRRKEMNSVERQFMRRANGYFGIRAATLLLVALTIGAIGWKVRADRRFENTRARVDQFITGEAGSVYGISELLRQDRLNAISGLKSELATQPNAKDSLRIHVGLALLGESDPDRIKRLVGATEFCSDAECPNLVAALSQSRVQALKEIENQIETDDDKRWARLEILKMFLDPNHVPVSSFKFGPDPSRRSTLIHLFENWHADLDTMPAMLRSTTDEAALSGLCISLGRIQPNRFNDRVLNELTLRMQELYSKNEHSSVHGASRWALTNWSVSLPSLAPSMPGEESDWWVNSSQMTMVRIDAGIVPNEIRESEDPDVVDCDFYISDCEVSIEQFEEFLSDPDYSADQKPIGWIRDQDTGHSKHLAVHRLSKEDAILFCNWLSTKNDLSVCYRKTGKKLVIDSDVLKPDQPREVEQWEFDRFANGYRLPSHEEWEMAARGGCTTNYFFANEPLFDGLSEYVWCAINSLEDNANVIHSVAQKIPNQWGLFDVLGNVNEICWGHKSTNNLPDAELYTWSRGGSIKTSISLCQFKYPWSLSLPVRDKHTGFRVAMTAKEM